MTFPTDFKIDEIVAFACGRIAQTLEDRLSPWTDIIKRRVPYQHGLICTIRKTLSKRMGARGIQCFAQDPAYTTIDYELLKMHAITTIDDPEGFLMIDDTTLVISMAPNIPVKGIIAHTAQPAMIVWDIDNGENTFCTDPTSSRLKEFLDSSYSRTEFPHDPDNFKDVAMYTKLGS
ncbi:hypothetical protein TMEN_8389 [Trichophyton mentagrophytes]|nr:hypothetical protein TMEN_8389 [Trichophyton mentagrophytes]